MHSDGLAVNLNGHVLASLPSRHWTDRTLYSGRGRCTNFMGYRDALYSGITRKHVILSLGSCWGNRTTARVWSVLGQSDLYHC